MCIRDRDRSNASAASDLGCAALHLGSAVQGAWLNVLINLGSIRDAAFAAPVSYTHLDVYKRQLLDACLQYFPPETDEEEDSDVIQVALSLIHISRRKVPWPH